MGFAEGDLRCSLLDGARKSPASLRLFDLIDSHKLLVQQGLEPVKIVRGVLAGFASARSKSSARVG